MQAPAPREGTAVPSSSNAVTASVAVPDREEGAAKGLSWESGAAVVGALAAAVSAYFAYRAIREAKFAFTAQNDWRRNDREAHAFEKVVFDKAIEIINAYEASIQRRLQATSQRIGKATEGAALHADVTKACQDEKERFEAEWSNVKRLLNHVNESWCDESQFIAVVHNQLNAIEDAVTKYVASLASGAPHPIPEEVVRKACGAMVRAVVDEFRLVHRGEQSGVVKVSS